MACDLSFKEFNSCVASARQEAVAIPEFLVIRRSLACGCREKGRSAPEDAQAIVTRRDLPAVDEQAVLHSLRKYLEKASCLIVDRIAAYSTGP